jgi:hypothetical protein
MRLENIRNCHVCSSTNLVPRLNVPIPDLMTDEETNKDVLQCDDCDTLHYIEEGSVSYEFSCRVNEYLGKKVIR